MKNWVQSLAFSGLFALLPLAADAQEFSLRTNLLWDAVSEPNIGLEFSVSDHWSVGANAGIKSWPRWLAWDWDKENPTHWRNLSVVPEARYYFDQVYNGLFLAGDAIYTHYNVGNIKFPFGMYPDAKDYRLQGDFYGGGLSVGYSWWMGAHWRIEAEAGVGVGYVKADKFECAHCGAQVGTKEGVAVVPKLGVNIAWNPVARDKRPKPGVVVSGRDTLTVLSAPVAFVVQLKDVQAPETAGDKLAKDNAWVVPIGQYRPLDRITREGRDSILTVRYPLDSDALDRSLAGNNAVLDRITAAVTALKADARTDEVLISVVGLASIEGPQERNDSLSVRRARAVVEDLKQHTGLKDQHFEVIGKGEAWDWFRAQLADGPKGFSTAEIETLQRIAALPDADERERKLKADKALYQKVADGLLADQRNAGYIRVYYGVAPDPATETFNREVMDLLKAKRYGDAVARVEQDPKLMACTLSDAEAMNAYGVALYFTALDKKDTDRETRALELLRRAARMGSEAARENLQGTEIYGPARKEFEAWKNTMNER